MPSCSRISSDGGRDIFIFTLDQLRALLDDGDFAPESAVHLREFQADVAAAYDDKWRGRKSMSMMELLVRYRTWSIPGISGTTRATAYVDEYSLRLSLSEPTLTSWEDSKEAWPWYTVQFFSPLSQLSTAILDFPDTRVLPGFNAFHVDAHRATVDYAELGGSAEPCGRHTRLRPWSLWVCSRC